VQSEKYELQNEERVVDLAAAYQIFPAASKIAATTSKTVLSDCKAASDPQINNADKQTGDV
jgi:hypothetical protein